MSSPSRPDFATPRDQPLTLPRSVAIVKNKLRTSNRRPLETKARAAAANLEFEEAARLRDEIKRLKLLDLEFANEVLTASGEAVDTGAAKRVRSEARADAAARFKKGRGRRPGPYGAPARGCGRSPQSSQRPLASRPGDP